MAQKKIILVVEDDPLVLNILDKILTRAGYEVIRAKDGEEGASRAKADPQLPDLILADIMMPRVDGYELRTALLADRDTRGIPFLFLTAKTARVDKAKAFALGSYRYLTKPFTQQVVLEELRLALVDAEERKRLTTLNPRNHSGSLAETSVHSLVDLFIVNGWNGKVLIRSGRSEGALRFENGEIVESNVGKGNNWLALEELLNWREGTFELERASF